MLTNWAQDLALARNEPHRSSEGSPGARQSPVPCRCRLNVAADRSSTFDRYSRSLRSLNAVIALLTRAAAVGCRCRPGMGSTSTLKPRAIDARRIDEARASQTLVFCSDRVSRALSQHLM